MLKKSLLILCLALIACPPFVRAQAAPLPSLDEYIYTFQMAAAGKIQTIDPKGFREIEPRDGHRVFVYGLSGVVYLMVEVDQQGGLYSFTLRNIFDVDTPTLTAAGQAEIDLLFSLFAPAILAADPSLTNEEAQAIADALVQPGQTPIGSWYQRNGIHCEFDMQINRSNEYFLVITFNQWWQGAPVQPSP